MVIFGTGKRFKLKNMEYILIFILECSGISLSVVQKITILDKKYTDFNKKQIFAVFMDEDWTTLIGSVIVLFLNLVAHFIVENYTTLEKSIENYDLYSFGLALVLGYAGQRLIYKWLGTAADALDKKVESKIG